MIKTEELSTLESCLNRAGDGEMLFVLRAKDPCAPHAIREWVKARVEQGLNALDDPKIKEALRCASTMDEQRGGGELK